MFTLGFGVWDRFLFQDSSVIRKNPTKGQFCCFLQILENQLCQPPTVKENFFDMPFLMSHAGVIHRGSKLDKSKKSVPQHLCASATMSLKEYESFWSFLMLETLGVPTLQIHSM